MNTTITAKGTGLQSGFAEAPNKFTINMQGHNVSLLAVAFDGPARPECMLTTQKDGSVDAAYKTPVPGEYKIHIKFNDKHIEGSPFKVKILGDKTAAVGKIKVSGASKEGKALITNEIIVDATEAGITSGLQCAMEGPSKPEISFKSAPDGTIRVNYKPTVAGQYKMNLKFDGIPLPGSPYNITVKK
jgi:filamin